MTDEAKTNEAPKVPGSAEGAGGPNLTPTFGKKSQDDENANIVDQHELNNIKEGSEAASRQNRFSVTDQILAAQSAGEAQDGFTQYASPSIARLKVGPFQFDNGVLRIENNRVEQFEKLLNTASPRTKQAVSKIDREGGEAIARRFLERTGGKRTSGVDTSDNIPPASNPNDAQNQPR